MSYRSPYDPSSHGSRLDLLETRAGEPDDAVAIAVIQSDWLPHSMADLERVAIRDLTNSATAGSSSYICVAQHEGHIVGYGNCAKLPGMGGNTSLPHAWYLTGVNVPEVWRRHGIGRGLIAHRLDWLVHRTSEVFFTTGESNLPSQLLHADFGFTEVRRGFTTGVGENPEEGCILYRTSLNARE